MYKTDVTIPDILGLILQSVSGRYIIIKGIRQTNAACAKHDMIKYPPPSVSTKDVSVTVNM